MPGYPTLGVLTPPPPVSAPGSRIPRFARPSPGGDPQTPRRVARPANRRGRANSARARRASGPAAPEGGDAVGEPWRRGSTYVCFSESPQAMALGVVGRKVGMTRVFDEPGVSTPVTVVEVEEPRSPRARQRRATAIRRCRSRPARRRRIICRRRRPGHFAKAEVDGRPRGLWEFRLDGGDAPPRGSMSPSSRSAARSGWSCSRSARRST